MEELESDALTRLVEIMLRPPTTLVVDDYYADGDDGGGGGGGDIRRRRRRVCRYRWDDDGDGDDEGMDEDHEGMEEEVDHRDGGAEGESSDDGGGGAGHSDEGWEVASGGEEEEDRDDYYDVGGRRTTMTAGHLATAALVAADARSKPRYPAVTDARRAVDELGKSASPHDRRRVCQYAFRRNDIVWVCRTCQVDETCVLCHECFTRSDHEGHDVAFYHAQAGGCCDCGDVDAWDPKGFCDRHGGPRGSGQGAGGEGGDGLSFGGGWGCGVGCGENDAAAAAAAAATAATAATTTMGVVEPAVLGSVRAIADFLVGVVRSGVEEGYRRANPLTAFAPSKEGTVVVDDGASANAVAFTRLSDDEGDLGRRDRRDSGNLRRSRSSERGNTVADTDTVDYTATSIATSEQLYHAAHVHAVDDGDDPVKMTTTGHPSTPMLHEVQFNPSMASSSSQSKKYSSSLSSKRDSSASDANSADISNRNVFDPKAAGSSSSSSALSSSSSKSSSALATSPTNHLRAAKKACRGGEVREKTPARALGDLGRKEHGLFLVLHCDDVHFGPSASPSHHSKVIAALKELYSSPGGSGMGAWGGVNAAVGGGIGGAALLGAAAASVDPFGTTGNHHFAQQQQPQRLLLSPLTRNSLFRAPHVEAIFERIVRIVKKQGDLIVWGTQEILAECGELLLTKEVLY